MGKYLPGLTDWIERVRAAIDEADAEYPFLLCGTDWLAFAHLVIAVAFYGPCRAPVRKIRVVEFGVWWSVIDMAFGVLGVIPLYVVRQRIKRLEALTVQAAATPALGG